MRSLYLVRKRTVRVPFMEVFDLPENSGSCPRRHVSVVAPQALSLLNGKQTVELAQQLAGRIQESGCGTRTDADRIRELFFLTLQRIPTQREEVGCQAFLQSHTLQELCRVVLNLNEFIYLD